MTVETFTPTPAYTIATTGPYTITHPYRAGEDISVTVIANGVAEVLDPAEYTVDPDGSDSQGTVTLSAAALTQHTGATLLISRDTRIEQGWEGLTVREAGVEAQLDQMTMATQDARSKAGNAAFQLQTGEDGLVADADARALRFTAFDVNGDPMLILLSDIQTVFAPDVVPRHFETVAEMLNSLEEGEGEGTIWRAAHAMFEEADPSEATPHHTTAGGVKLMEAGTQFTKYLRFRQCVQRGWVYQKWDVVEAEGEKYVFLDDGNTDLFGIVGWAAQEIDGGTY